MKNDILNSALGGIDDDILRSAGDPLEKEPERPARKRRIKTWHIVAACHVIAAALAVTALIISLGGKSDGAVAESSSEETAVAFTKEAKLYFGGDEYARAEELTFETGDIGGYLGEAEITEGENSAKAGLYAINGVSPEIAAAAKMPGGGYTIYFNSSYSAQTLGDLESDLNLNGGSVVPAERLDAEQLAAFIVSFERAQSATNRAGAEDIGEIINNYSVNVGALQGTVGFTTNNYVVANFFGKETAFKADEEETEEDDILSQIFAKIVSDKYACLDQDHDTEEFLESLVQAGLYHENTDDTRITNTTPQWLYDLYGAQIFWVHHRNRSYIWYNGEIYDIGGIGSMSGVSVIPCDFDHDGCVDLLTFNLYGSGISGVEYGVFNMKTCEFHDVTRFMTLTRSVGCMVSKDGSYYIYERRYEENGWSAPRITGQLIAYPSEPSGVRYVEFDKHFQEGLGIETRLDGFDIIDVASYWSSLKGSSGKDFFTLEEIYAECANLAKQNVAYDKNGPDSGKYVADIVLLGENVAETKDVLDLMLFTVENCFAEYTYSDETQLYGGIRVISYAKEIGEYGDIPEGKTGFDRAVIVCGSDGVIGMFSSADLESGDYNNELSARFAQKYPAPSKINEKAFGYTVHEDGKTCAVVSVSRFYPDPELVIPSEIGGYKVTEIASRAFRGQTGFTSAVIPESVTSIGDHAFSGCMRLSSVIIPESVTYIGEAAFSCCAIKSINVPAGVTVMRSKVFWECIGLKDIYYGGTAEQWSKMVLEDTWDYAVSDYTVHCADGESVLYPQVFNSEMPEDFSFTVVWNTYGISSYDSQSGKLVKTNDATDVSKYTAYVTLSKEDLQTVYGYLLSDINITKYPESYDPFNAPDAQIRMSSEPNQTIIVTVNAYGWTKTVNCTGIAYGSPDDCYCEEAKAFLTSVRKIVDLITSLPEWEAFPDYEFYYE